MMRMLAWVNLLQADGYVNRFLMFTHVLSQPRDWLGGKLSTVILALVYGYIPYLILPLFASLDRIDRSHLEAARDLGASPWSAFRTVTLPLSKTGILGGAVLITLPMFGDYYTPNIVSPSPKTSMIGNQIDLYFHGGPAADDRRRAHDRARRLPDAPDGLLHVEHPPGAARGRGGGSAVTAVAEPERRRGLRPSRVSAAGSGTRGGSRASSSSSPGRTSSGRSCRCSSPSSSPSTPRARARSGTRSRRAGTGATRSTPSGTTRRSATPWCRASSWPGPTSSSPSRSACSSPLASPAGTDGARASSNFIMLFPLVTPEIVMGVSLLLVFTQLFTFIHTGTFAQILGPRDVLDLVRRRHRPWPALLDRSAVRGGGGRSRRVSLRRAHASLAAAADARRSSPPQRSCSPSRPTTSSSASGSRRAATRTPSRSRSTRRRRAAPLPSVNAIATIMMVSTLLIVTAGFLDLARLHPRRKARGEGGRGFRRGVQPDLAPGGHGTRRDRTEQADQAVRRGDGGGRHRPRTSRAASSSPSSGLRAAARRRPCG